MRILLTGGTGLIGSEIAQRLAMRGDEIVLLVRSVEAVRGRLGFPATCFEWSHDRAVPPEALNKVDAVIHLAGEPVASRRWTDEKKKLIRDSRIEGTRHIVEAIQAHGPNVKTFVHGSAMGIYGDRGDEMLDATSLPGPGFLAEVVRDWEAEAAKLSIPVSYIRTSMVLSRHGGALSEMLPLFRANVAGKLGWNGAQWVSWIHLSDIARLFIHALDIKHRGVLEGAAPEPVRNSDFTKVLCRELGVIQNVPVPAFVLKALYGEMASVILESQRVVPKAVQQSGFKFEFSKIDEALGEILRPLQGSTYEKKVDQWVPASVKEVWPFFCDEKNLETLTPDFLNFKVKSKSTDEIGDGTLIDYDLRLNGIPLGWQSRIEDWEPGKKFVDTQVHGPYSYWHHTHEFIPLGGGTLLRDRIRYRMPLGWLGAMASGWKVHNDVATIFDFRRKKIAELFGT